MTSFNSESKYTVLIIDPQIDFYPGGSLAIPTANEDSERIAEFIRRHSNQIENIHITLDSHHKLHIAHGAFWTNENGESPSPFTLVHHADIVANKWTPKNSALRQHALDYTAALEKKGRFVLIIWPEHCLIGTPGNAVEPIVGAAIQDWALANLKNISYVNKGMNCLTEMYSAIAAEIPVESDPSTDFNRPFLAELNKADKLVICGQALSHCVNFTMRDVLANWTKSPSQLVLLSDGASAVPGFEASAAQFVQDMKDAGCTVTTCAEL